MAKNKNLKAEEDVEKTGSTGPVCNIESFIEDNPKTKGSIAGDAFRRWYVSIEGKSILNKLPKTEWESLLKKFLSQEVK